MSELQETNGVSNLISHRWTNKSVGSHFSPCSEPAQGVAAFICPELNAFCLTASPLRKLRYNKEEQKSFSNKLGLITHFCGLFAACLKYCLPHRINTTQVYSCPQCRGGFVCFLSPPTINTVSVGLMAALYINPCKAYIKSLERFCLNSISDVERKLNSIYMCLPSLYLVMCYPLHIPPQPAAEVSVLPAVAVL